MGLKSGFIKLAATAAGGALLAGSIAGCSNMSAPRTWGTCAAVGAIIGATGGAAAGIGIAQKADGSSKAKTAGGFAGAAAGAVLGGLVGHYFCDPIIAPPPPPPPPPPPVAEAPPPPPPPPQKEKLVLRGVHFDFNKSKIRPGDAAVLDEAAATLKANPNVNINVNGYCDAIGGEAYNLKLSDRRANSVVGYLVQAGIPESRLTPHGYGKTNFVATNDTDEGRAQNRRVELVPVD